MSNDKTCPTPRACEYSGCHGACAAPSPARVPAVPDAVDALVAAGHVTAEKAQQARAIMAGFAAPSQASGPRILVSPPVVTIDGMTESFQNEFCPYKGSPDPWIVWRAAWQSALKHSATAAAEAPEPLRPDIIEKLTYHQHERDDMTLDDVLSYLASGWKTVHGRTERQLILQLCGLLAGAPEAPAQAAPKMSREEARRYCDSGFQFWLDESVTENAEFTVFDTLKNVHDAYSGWCAHPFYAAATEAPTLTSADVHRSWDEAHGINHGFGPFARAVERACAAQWGVRITQPEA